MEYTVVFFTHSGAIKYHRYLNSIGIQNETMPVPRKLSSNCGLGVKFKTDQDINSMITEDIDKIFKMDCGRHVELYSCD